MLRKGQVLNNRYQINDVLGEGGFGAVYKVWDDNLQRLCAIKENLQVSVESQKQFKREATMLANLNHPHLVRVTDYFIIANQGQYLVMDYVEGEDLQTILTKNAGPLPVEQSLTWIKQICDALIYIHAKNPPIIHRDIKPANIRITPQKNAVLVDFGLAKEFDDSVNTTVGARGLTPHFAAPEQHGMGGTDAQSDIYSLGVTLYCLLTYRLPPDSVDILVGNANPPPPARDVNRNIPDAISDALQHAMQIRRTDRYKSAGDFKIGLFAERRSFTQAKVVEPSEARAGKLTDNKLTLSNGMEFMRVPAGKFVMGDADKQHTVDIPYDYWMARFPVTNELYNACAKAKRINHPVDGWEKRKDHPVVSVSWNDAMEYCKWLSNLLKAELPSGSVLRLPTEGEWEKAARGEHGNEYPWGNTFDKNKCNSEEGGKHDTTPMGLYSPQGDSPYGCADMSGNVGEWTCSLYEDYPFNVKNIIAKASDNDRLVLRGGRWDLSQYDMRVSGRVFDHPHSKWILDGFRVVVSPPVVETPKPIQVVTPKIVTPPSNKLTLSNGMEFIRVPAGKFLMGSKKDNNLSYESEQHQHTVDVVFDYWMARYPVTNEQYNAYVKAKKINHPVSDWQKKKDHPINFIKWVEATDYCKWLNNLLSSEMLSGLVLRLPSEAEWEKCARGTNGSEYPWGNEFDQNNCNSSENTKGDTTSVGLYSPQGDSVYGCADMSGNVWEWTHSLMRHYPYDVSDGREEEKGSTRRVLRGGSFYDNFRFARCACRILDAPIDRNFNVGFRTVISTYLPENVQILF